MYFETGWLTILPDIIVLVSIFFDSRKSINCFSVNGAFSFTKIEYPKDTLEQLGFSWGICIYSEYFASILFQKSRLCLLILIKSSNFLINQNMNLKIFLKSKKPIKTIIKDALLIKNGNTVVYVIEDSIAKLKGVKTGISYQDSIEIIEGLNVGEKVVTRGNERLRPNQKVQIEEAN